ncbi:MAG TPA: hypothetical protein VEI58_11820 [Chthoniobacterales bacterium]|nr:hypothetical protein [Chthoniobacterales bacterium]
MIASNGRVTITINLASLNRGPSAEGKPELETVDFGVGASSFFTILVFNDVLRTTLPGSLELVPSGSSKLTKLFGSSFNQLVVERTALGGTYDLVVRDGKSGFVFFNVEGDHYDYNPINHLLQINGGRLLVSDELAQQLGRKENAPLIVGSIAITTTMDLIETTKLSNGAVVSAELPSADSGAGAGSSPNATLVPGPDVIVGDLPALIQTQTGNVNGFVGLSLGTTSCNNGNRPLDWFALPSSNDHPVIPQNLYRMSGGTVNADRFEQIGQSWLKHAFEALEDDDCSFGCNTSHCTTGTHLCEGCSDPYSASLNGSQTSLGSRAWVNPFTGSFPTSPNPNDHTGHVHDVTSHRILVNMNDLNTTLNPGATYYGESQYVTPHEYTWCQAHPGQCNMYNNVSYRQFLVTGTSNFTFTPSGATVRTTPAIYAWTGATITRFEPDPGNDGIGFLGYKVTNPTTGVWHYEYAVYNENLDRAVQSFSVPLGCGVTVSNLDFHAPPQQPGWANDGTQNDAGYSSTPWSSNQTASTLSWSSETFAQNQNANAIRWGTLYNFRFDSNQPPQAANATLGFFKTGSPITVAIQAPASNCGINLVSASSRLTHGSAGDFDINMPVTGTSGVEDRSSSTYNAVFTFDAPVTSGSVTVTSGTATVGAITFSGNEMRAALTGVTDVQTVVLHTSNINGDGQAHGDVSFSFLIGDIDGDRTVGTTDKNSLSANKGLPVTGANFRNDLNLSGVVDKPDQALFNANKGHHL